METRARFAARKRDHLRLALDPAHEARGWSGFDSIRLPHVALPEIDLAEVSLETQILGRLARTPFIIPGMTAGHEAAPRLNRALARACENRGWALGVGSQRAELKGTTIDRWSRLRETAPTTILVANLGLSQLIEAPIAALRALVAGLRADALAIHCNALQEALQPEGTPRFRGGVGAIRRAVEEAGVPVVLKETGCGFSERALTKLQGIGFAAIDVSGLGGTHWGRIEGARSQGIAREAARAFADWGVPTTESIVASVRLRGPEVWASGGVRTGVDAAKALALGARAVGFAKPALEAARQGRLEEFMETRELELRIALFCTGCRRPADLAGLGLAKGPG